MILFFFILATAIVIGLEATEYSAPATDLYHVVCAHIQWGSKAGSEIAILYIVADNGMQVL